MQKHRELSQRSPCWLAYETKKHLKQDHLKRESAMCSCGACEPTRIDVTEEIRKLLGRVPCVPLEMGKKAINSPKRLGPDEFDVKGVWKHTFGPVKVASRSISMYPEDSGGSLNCDAYALKRLAESGMIVCIADGCGLGQSARAAAQRACEAMVDCMTDMIKLSGQNCTATSIGNELICALSQAHICIINDADDPETAGSTTMLAGVLLPVAGSPGVFAFVSVSVGDCKLYFRKASTRRITDMSQSVRNNGNASDPGGRIGATDALLLPDFRNLQVECCFCVSGDMLILVTDGVHDNFDPELRGLTPKDAFAGGCDDTWDNRRDDRIRWACCELSDVIMQSCPLGPTSLSPLTVVQGVLDCCWSLTQPSREWFAHAQSGRLPSDYKLYPGKLDHATCLCLQIT